MRGTQIYEFIKKVKAGKAAADCRKRNPKTNVKTAAFIVHLDAAVEEDRQMMIRKLTLAHGVLLCTIHSFIHKDLSLAKKLKDECPILD